MKKRYYMVILAILCLFSITCSLAEDVSPCADTVFADATPILYSGKYVVFTASTYEVMDSVCVTSVRLEKKINGSWTHVKYLKCPTPQADCLQYTRTVYYTSEIGTGTYRVVATFNADGHSITRTSNERTY